LDRIRNVNKKEEERMRFAREKRSGEPYRCKDCGKYFWSGEELAIHFSAEHDLTEDIVVRREEIKAGSPETKVRCL
jgi:hypothetical protein